MATNPMTVKSPLGGGGAAPTGGGFKAPPSTSAPPFRAAPVQPFTPTAAIGGNVFAGPPPVGPTSPGGLNLNLNSLFQKGNVQTANLARLAAQPPKVPTTTVAPPPPVTPTTTVKPAGPRTTVVPTKSGGTITIKDPRDLQHGSVEQIEAFEDMGRLKATGIIDPKTGKVRIDPKTGKPRTIVRLPRNFGKGDGP